MSQFHLNFPPREGTKHLPDNLVMRFMFVLMWPIPFNMSNDIKHVK